MSDQNTTAVSAPPKKKLSFALKYLYGVGDAGFNLMTNVETYYFMDFLLKTALFGPVMAGLISTIFTTVDACLSWVYGGILNGTKAKKWGRYRSWLVLLPWIVPFLYMFMFIRVSSSSEILSAIVIIAAGIISHFVWNIPYVANVTLISVVGKTPEDRATLSSSRGTWNNIASIAFSYLGLPLAVLLGGVVGANYQWAALAFVLGVVMVIGYFCHFKMTKGYEAPETDDSVRASYNKIKIGEMFSSLFKNPQLIVLMIVDIARWSVKFVTGAAAIFYFRDAMHNPGLMAPYLLAIGIAATVGAFTMRYVAKLFSNRTTMIISMFAMAAFLVLAFFLYANGVVVIVMLTLTNVFYGMAYSTIPALYADTVVYSTWKTNKNAAGWIMGLQNLPLKIGVFLRGPILSACLVAVGWTADVVLEGTARQGMTVAFALIPGILCAVGGLLFIIGFRITREKVNQYQAEIDARTQSAQ